ncbi:MAG TPA: ATP-binding protein [Candidatus Binatia bacterium]|nr:ATP-binding protein [Candidatus Binatia bacterium]
MIVSLLLGVLVVLGLDVYLSLKRIRTDLLKDMHREVASISRTLRIALEKAGNGVPEHYFSQVAAEISGFENILGLVFYNREGLETWRSPSLQSHSLPQVDVRAVVTTQTPVEGLFREGRAERYYRVEPIASTTGEGITAFLVLEDFALFTHELHSRVLEMILATLILLVVLAMIVSMVIRQSITQPLQTFARRIHAVGQGQFDHRLHLARHDEIGQLADEFDRMAARLQEAQHRLVTEQEEKLYLERALRHSEKLAALGRLASRLAHEIGTPLYVIQGRAEQLLQRGSLPEKDRGVVNVIIAQIERISRFIRQLLTLSRRPGPQLRPVSLNDVVRRVWQVVSDQRDHSGVEITLELAEELPPILGDPDQLQQVLLNLSVNALQAVGSAGRVTLSTRCDDTGSSFTTGMVEAVVVDTGPGVPPEHLPYLFEPFFTTKGMANGTGLGLAISREIVLNHHGEIRVESTPGQGSRFIVSLPRAGARESREARPVCAQREVL